jgi:hypothetical protein
MWSGATKKDLKGKLQLVQNRAARLALGCTQRANINNMHVTLSWLKVEERLTSSLLVFMRGIECTEKVHSEFRRCIQKVHSEGAFRRCIQKVHSEFRRCIQKVEQHMLTAPSCLSKLLAHSSDTHAYPTRHATRGLFTVPKSRTDYGWHTVLHRAMTT